MELYPLLTGAHYRHGPGETPWAGCSMGAVLGREIPHELTGESLEVSALPGRESIILNGALRGQPLSRVADIWGDGLTGDGGFPFVLKFIDAAQRLSVQVHPGDDYAGLPEGGRGKSEAWVIIAAAPGAEVICGVEGGRYDEFLASVGRGQPDISALARLPVAPGDVIYIPSGTVHAIGGGIVLYEVQQSSDLTYRVHDWGRAGRELHIRQALDVIRPRPDAGRASGAAIALEGGHATAYISDQHFELGRIDLSGEVALPNGRLTIVTSLGDLALRWAGGLIELPFGHSAVVPAALGGATLHGTGGALYSATPDPAALRALLGARAGLVAGLI